MTCEGIQAVKYLVQAGFMYVAIYVSLSRVADHYHHLSDIIAGMLYGATAAILVVRDNCIPSEFICFHNRDWTSAHGND